MNLPCPKALNRTKIQVLLLLSLVVSCQSVRRLEEGQYLLTDNTILLKDGTKPEDRKVGELIVQKPNSRLFGYPLRLNLHNLAKPEPEESFRKWVGKKDKREQRLRGFLSDKQFERLEETFLVSGYSKVLKSIGEPPVVLDSNAIRESVQRMQLYYKSRGYFNNGISFDTDLRPEKKKGSVTYRIGLGTPYAIDSVAYDIRSPEIDSLFRLHRSESRLRKGNPIRLTDFGEEQQRLTGLFRNSGIYNFQESSINFDLVGDTTALKNDGTLDVVVNIRNRRSTGADSITTQQYRVHRYNRINVYTDYSLSAERDTLTLTRFGDLNIYYREKLRYKPQALADAVFFARDSVYRDLDRIRTNRQINNLNVFLYPNIEFQSDTPRELLDANIYLVPKPKYFLNLDLDVTHSNIQQVGTAFSASVFSRNIFGGAETLGLSFRGSLGLLSDARVSEKNLTSEIGGDINLTFPRIWFPFYTKGIIPPYMSPQTRLVAGTNFQKNIGLDRQSFNTSLSYSWTPSSAVRNFLKLVDVEFVRNVNPDNFFFVYQNTYNSLDGVADGVQDPALIGQELFDTFFEESGNAEDPFRLSIPSGASAFISNSLDGTLGLGPEDVNLVGSIEERRQRLTENNLIVSTNYTLSKSANLNNNEDFRQWRITLESAGNLLSLIDQIVPFNSDDSGRDLVFGVPYTQYLKTEFDYIRHWDLPGKDVLAVRGFMGIAIPYGNSSNVPFVRSYFAGGSNDNRAWNAYSLGPGRTRNLNDFNEANFKLGFSAEYRFPIVGNLYGALFADAGNIWNVFDSETNPDAIFTGWKSLRDLALGSGLGLRVDFSYFVFRLDTGFKTYNPALLPGSRWFTDFRLDRAVFNVGINYPF